MGCGASAWRPLPSSGDAPCPSPHPEPGPGSSPAETVPLSHGRWVLSTCHLDGRVCVPPGHSLPCPGRDFRAQGSPSRPRVGCPQVRAAARQGLGVGDRALTAFLSASSRLCRVCFPGSLPHRDVPEDVRPGTPELLPVFLQLLRLWGECRACQGDSWASHSPPLRASTRGRDGACVGRAAGWGAVAWPGGQVSPGRGSKGQRSGAHPAVGRSWPRTDRWCAVVSSRWARDLAG